MKKIYLDITMRVAISAKDEVTTDEIMENIEISACTNMDDASIIETSVESLNIKQL